MPTAAPPYGSDDVRHRLMAIVVGLGVEPEVVEKASPHHLLDILDIPRAGVFSPLTMQERMAVLDARADAREEDENDAADEAAAKVDPPDTWEGGDAETGPHAKGADELIATINALRVEILALRQVMDDLRWDLAEARRTPDTPPLPDAEVEPLTDADAEPATDFDAEAEPPLDAEAEPPLAAEAEPPPPAVDVAAQPEPAILLAPGPEAAAPVAPPAPPRRGRPALYVVLGVLVGLIVVALLTGGVMLALAMGVALPRGWPGLRAEVVGVF